MDIIRVGNGYDVHRLVEGRPCILGGVLIPSDFGPDGHSDADVLTHALADALLGSIGLPDIGHAFPPSDPKFSGMDSQIILKYAADAVREAGFRIMNVDTTLVAEAPKISPYLIAMKAKLAETLDIPPSK